MSQEKHSTIFLGATGKVGNALQDGVDGIYPNAYMNCVHTQFELNVADKIPEADAVFDNFE